MSRKLNIGIAVLAVLAVLVMFVSSGEPVVFFLRGTSLERSLVALGRPNAIAFNLAVGYLVSALFWSLVVYLPERSRRSVLLDNLSRRYKSFRRSVLQILLWSSIGTHDSQMPDELSDHRRFKEYFKADQSSKWYAAMNGLQEDPDRMHELLLELEIFADEIAYVLNNANISDPQIHRFFKTLKENIYRLNHSTVYTYDQVKYVGQFLWSVLARWSFIDGQLEDDIIQTTIDRL